jgi:hypothetical protein
MAVLEKEFGGSALSSEFWNDMSATRVRAVVRAALLHEDPNATHEEAGRLAPGDIAAVTAAIRASMGWDKKSDEAPADPQ